MKSSFAGYSKSRKMGKKINKRIQDNNKVLESVKENDKSH